MVSQAASHGQNEFKLSIVTTQPNNNITIILVCIFQDNFVGPKLAHCELHQQNLVIDYDHDFILHYQSDGLLSEMIEI